MLLVENMWDERYNSSEYAYGTEPNEFLVEYFDQIPSGKVLSIAEGEGRNAVFLAKQGYDVTAVDGSAVGLQKARNLANENGVTIETIHADLADFDLGEEQWDGIISIFVPLPSDLRRAVYQKVEKALKPGGVFLMEAYTPEQIKYGTGGGSSVDTMQSKNSVEQELPGLKFTRVQELEREVIEGTYHNGVGSVVQVIALREEKV